MSQQQRRSIWCGLGESRSIPVCSPVPGTISSGWNGLRQLFSALFREGLESFDQNTPIGARFVNFLTAFAGFVTTFNEISDELMVRREATDSSGDHIAAVRTLIERFEAGWPQLRLGVPGRKSDLRRSKWD